MFRNFFSFIIPSLILCLALTACGKSLTEGEDFGDLLGSPSGLILTEDEHEHGWGRSDCLMCHNLNNIHLVDQSSLEIDVEAIQEQTFDEGESSCAICHGVNGI